MWPWNKKKPQDDQRSPAPGDDKPSREELSRDLLDAVLADDTEKARRVFDSSFWDKAEFKPDSYHLLMAAQKGSRDMVKLLTFYGAKWTDDETKIAKLFIPREKFAHVEGPLKSAGVRTQFSAQEMKKIDVIAAIGWGRRAVAEGKARGLKESQLNMKALDEMVIMAFMEAVFEKDFDRMRVVLPYRPTALGRGTPEAPLNADIEVNALLMARGTKTALGFLDTLIEAGLTVKPLTVKSMDALMTPSFVPDLHRRGLLAQEQPQARAEVLGVWTALQERADFDGYVIELDKVDVAQRRAEMKTIAEILFSKDRPVTAQEAEDFIGLHESRARHTPDALAAAEKELLRLGFFEGPTWTAGRLRRLAATHPKPEPGLAETFNKMSMRERVSETVLNRRLDDEAVAVICSAHLDGVLKMDARETLKVVDYLASKVRKDKVPESALELLQGMQKGGADFSLVDPMNYLGKTGPAFAKTLLDANAVDAEDFDLEGVSRLYGGQISLVTPQGHKDYAKTEFMCQLILELAEPHKFEKLHGDKNVSYQKLFVKEWVDSLGARRGGTITVTRKPRPVPPPSRPSRPSGRGTGGIGPF